LALWSEKIKWKTALNKTVVLVTGGFDPLHSGHIEYFKAAKQLGDKLVVGLNSDEWLIRKKGRPFMLFEERIAIIKELKVVDKVIGFDDSDGSACQAIFQTMSTNTGKIIFANGGDRTNTTTPEYSTYSDHPQVEFAFGVGGEHKQNSSSWILDKWKTNKTERDWGYWRVLDDKQPQEGIKVKELVINPGCSLSNQRHKDRSEYWYILSGSCKIEIEKDDIIQTNAGRDQTVLLTQNKTHVINVYDWHRAYNPYDEPCHILEVQYGKKCIEEDIERR
jgi:cytidyltransferase-like protein